MEMGLPAPHYTNVAKPQTNPNFPIPFGFQLAGVTALSPPTAHPPADRRAWLSREGSGAVPELGGSLGASPVQQPRRGVRS